MSYTQKLSAGAAFPQINVMTVEGDRVTLGSPTGGADWQLVVVYRGKHCPLCTKYLNQLETYRERLLAAKIDLVAVSADSAEQLKGHQEQLNVSFPLYCGLTEAQMRDLGLYISLPRSAEETDHNFAEPGLFVINAQGMIQLTDISNGPFARPDLETLLFGLEWIRNPENNYPIRGTAAYV